MEIPLDIKKEFGIEEQDEINVRTILYFSYNEAYSMMNHWHMRKLLKKYDLKRIRRIIGLRESADSASRKIAKQNKNRLRREGGWFSIKTRLERFNKKVDCLRNGN